MRGFDLARNPGLNNTTEYGAGEFPLATRPPAGVGTQSTNEPTSMFRSRQAEESYPDHSSMRRQLERAQRERDKDNLDRDHAVPDRDQAKLDRDQAILEQEREQEQRLRKNVANSDRIKSETERLQRRQQPVASSKEKKRTTTEPVKTRFRPGSKMKVDEAPRSSGGFNLDRVAQEHMNEGLGTWTPPEPVPSMRNLEANRIRPLMDIALPRLTSSSTSGSQSGTGTSRLRELQERLHVKALESVSNDQPPEERASSEERFDLELQKEH